MGFYEEEDPSVWKRWWVGMWAAIFAGLVASAFLVPFRTWALVATCAFGIPEGVGLLRKRDPYPPLTYVTRKYVPRWLAFTLIYGLVGAVGAFWLGFPHPTRVGALLALLGWLGNHFSVTYSE